MLANVTMTPVIAERRNHISDIRNKKEKSLDIKKFESLCSFRSSSSIGLGRHAFAGVGTNSSSSI
jgi:hypothetical protein